jgi:hypothetical protein
MTDLLTQFDRQKKELAGRIEAASTIEDAVNVMDEYWMQLHRNMSTGLSFRQSRQAGWLLEILRYAVRTLTAVDTHVHSPFPRSAERPGEPISIQFLVFGGIVQTALLLALMLTLLSADKVLWVAVFLVIALLGTEIYLHIIAWRNRSRALQSVDSAGHGDPQKIDVELKVSRIHTFMDCIADALTYADKMLIDPALEKASGSLEKEPQILKLFQDLFEARTFHDGEWALKKVNHIQAILWEQGIVAKEFNPEDAADAASFDIEPGGDPSITEYLTIRPAFLKNGRVLLRGRAAAPFSADESTLP